MEKFIDKRSKTYWVDDRTGKKTKEEIAQIERDGKYTLPEKKYLDNINVPKDTEKPSGNELALNKARTNRECGYSNGT